MKSFLTKVFSNLAALFVAMGLFVVFWVMLFVIIALFFDERVVPIKENSVLAFDLSVNIMDSPRDITAFDLIEETFDGSIPKVLYLKSVIDGIDRAAEDDRISALYLHGSLRPENNGSSYAALREIRDAIKRFKKTNKPVVAYLVNSSMRDYYLISTADTLIHNPFGLVTLNGLSAKLIYFGNAFEKYGIEVQTSRVGKYKSAVEIFTGDKMSTEDRFQTTELIESLWNNILIDIGDIRNIAPETLADISTNHGYFSSQEALEFGLVDESAYFDEVRDKLIDIGEFDEDLESFRQISFTDYLAEGRQRTAEVLGLAGNGQPKIAVVYAEGMIVNGEGNFDQVGGDRVSRELRKLRHDDEVKAIVLRVNSPGGSPVASEVVLRELKLIKNEKPVVVSMGSLAASGGYWIAANADTIIAEATTITGSIGVFGIYPNFKEIANRTGITFDGVKTSKYADIFTIARPKTDDELDLLQEYTDFIYDAFIERVAEGRNLNVDEVKAIAEGRIWSGAEALEVGLVDKLGGLDDAIEHAVDIAGIKGEWQLIQVPEETDAAAFIEKFLGGSPKNEPLGTEGLLSQKLRQMQRELPWLKALNDPHGVYALLPLSLKLN